MNAITATDEQPTVQTPEARFDNYRLQGGRIEVLRSDDTVGEVYYLTEWSLACPEVERPLAKAIFFGTPAVLLLGTAYLVGTWWAWAVLGVLALPMVLISMIHMVEHPFLVLESEAGRKAHLLVGGFNGEFLMFCAEIAEATRIARGLPLEDDDEEDEFRYEDE